MEKILKPYLDFKEQMAYKHCVNMLLNLDYTFDEAILATAHYFSTTPNHIISFVEDYKNKLDNMSTNPNTIECWVRLQIYIDNRFLWYLKHIYKHPRIIKALDILSLSLSNNKNPREFSYR